jgi:hypothetical protein
MLAIDIESLGLNKKRDLITVISIYDDLSHIKRVLRFVEIDVEDGRVRYKNNFRDLVTELMGILDKADHLCGFNAISFDIPFIACQFKIPYKTVTNWKNKTFDILNTARCHFERTFSLDLLFKVNPVSSGGKTGTGLQAVEMAKNGQWEELEAYCMEDSRLIHEISSLKIIKCPEGGKWRRKNGGRTNDPSRVAQIDTSKFPKLSFSIGNEGCGWEVVGGK